MCRVIDRNQDWRTSEPYLKGFAQPVEWGSDPFETAMVKYERELDQLASAFIKGGVTPEEFEEELTDILRRMHIDCHYQGQVMADAVPPSMILARSNGGRVAQAEIQYARAFAGDLATFSPKVWDAVTEAWRESAIALRTRSYMGRARGTATDGWASASAPSDLIDWVLGKEDNCPRCPVMASDSPWLLSGSTTQYEYKPLFIKPGENLTPCKFNCGCYLRRHSDGALSPQPFSFADPMAA